MLEQGSTPKIIKDYSQKQSSSSLSSSMQQDDTPAPTKRNRVQSDLMDYFSTNKNSSSSPSNKKKQTKFIPPHKEDDPSLNTVITNSEAEIIGKRLNTKPIYLTDNGKSWYVHAKHWMPSSSSSSSSSSSERNDLFETEWNLHPTERRELKVYGRIVKEKRWSQAWGVKMTYSGAINHARSVEESVMIPMLLDKINKLYTGDCDDSNDNNIHNEGREQEQGGDSNDENDSTKLVQFPFNACLQNWYEPDDTIGLHADDESYLRHEYPIFSLSWGGTRRFLFRSKTKNNKIGGVDKIELWLEDGDLLVMGGACQMTHKHEVPKRRVTMDPPTSNRINWTIRVVKEE